MTSATDNRLEVHSTAAPILEVAGMRPLIVTENITLDGVIGAAGGLAGSTRPATRTSISQTSRTLFEGNAKRRTPSSLDM
jgi:hypothetical protein